MDGFPETPPDRAGLRPVPADGVVGVAARDNSERYTVFGDLYRHRWVYLGLVVALLVWGWTDVRFRGILQADRPDRHKTDFTAYTEASKAFFDGRDPYAVTNVRGWGYLYPPLFALLVRPVADFDSQTQVFVFFLFSVLTAWGCAHELRRLADGLRRDGASRFGAASVNGLDWLAMALAVSLPALNTLQRGQIGILKLYPLLLGARWILFGNGSRWSLFVGGVALALPVALKVTPALPVATLLLTLGVRGWLRRGAASSPDTPTGAWPTDSAACRGRFVWGSLGAVAGSLLWWIALPAVFLGWNGNLRSLERWYDKVIAGAETVRTHDFGGDVTSPRNQSLANAAYRMGNWLAYRLKLGPDDRVIDSTETFAGTMPMDGPVAESAVRAARVLTAVGLLAVVFALGTRCRRADVLLALGLGCAGTLVISPVSRGHYFVLLAPLVLTLPAWLGANGRAGRGGLWAWIPAGLCLAHYLGLEFTGRIGLMGVGTAAWLWGTLALVAIGLRSERVANGCVAGNPVASDHAASVQSSRTAA
jgi:hypothetical protein